MIVSLDEDLQGLVCQYQNKNYQKNSSSFHY